LLGDVDPIVRKNAKAAIENFGNTAISELTKAANFETTKDYETQIMAAKILATLQNTIALKEAEKFSRGERELKGWPVFIKFTGDTPESRLIFRDIYLQNHEELLRATGLPTPDNKRKHTASFSQLNNLFESPDLTQVCRWTFIATNETSIQHPRNEKISAGKTK